MDLSNPTPRWGELRNGKPGVHEFLSALAEAEFEAGETGIDSSAVNPEGLGEEVRDFSEAEVTEEAIRLPKARVQETSIREVLEGVYRAKGRQYFAARADHFCEQMGVNYEQIQIRNQKTRWAATPSAPGRLASTSAF